MTAIIFSQRQAAEMGFFEESMVWHCEMRRALNVEPLFL